MALLGEEAKKIPGAYKIGTGTLTFVSAATAYVKPDQNEYGREAYIHGGLADPTCLYKLNAKYKKGDRVTFTYVPATMPERGCKWAAVQLSKLKPEDDEASKSSTTVNGYPKFNTSFGGDGGGEKIIRGAKGSIEWNGISFAYIGLFPPYDGRAFMADKSVTGNFKDDNGIFTLAKVFPVGTRVVCDLYPQQERKKCKFFAKNVVVVEESPIVEVKAKKEESRYEEDSLVVSTSESLAEKALPVSSSPRVPITKPQFLISPTPTPKSYSGSVFAQSNGHSTASSLTTDDRKYQPIKPERVVEMVDAVIQTDSQFENKILESLFGDEEIFRVICARQPDIMYRYMCSGYAVFPSANKTNKK